MKQADILDRLQEAARLAHEVKSAGDRDEKVAHWHRINAIHVELTDALYDGDFEPHHHDTTNAILSNLFVDTCANRPERLVGLFPLFAVLCGERASHYWLGDTDWTVADKVPVGGN